MPTKKTRQHTASFGANVKATGSPVTHATTQFPDQPSTSAHVQIPIPYVNATLKYLAINYFTFSDDLTRIRILVDTIVVFDETVTFGTGFIQVRRLLNIPISGTRVTIIFTEFGFGVGLFLSGGITFADD